MDPRDPFAIGDLFGPADELCSWIVCHEHAAADHELLDRAELTERMAGRGALVAGLDDAARILGGLPPVLAELRTALAKGAT